tara:strand:+ start:290 stop:1717 length:1428 start_codon:yes stop_codon:yes gene_type:complete
LQQLNFISQNTALILVLLTSLIFAAIGIFYSRKYRGYSNYLTAGRKIETLSLTSSLVSSALGAWILFGPASAATWGGIGAVIGYSLGTAFPMIVLVYLGKKIRKSFPTGITFTQFIFFKIGKNLFKFIILLSIFYMFIFLCAEITAVAMLINYISSVPLWITAALIIVTTLIYTLYGGLRASILTDNFQFLIIIILLLICMYNIFDSSFISYKNVIKNSGDLLSSKYIPNYTSGLTFFIAVAATNLFHQGNWQRVFAAKNNDVLNKSLKLSFFIIIPIVFFMGITGIIAVSNQKEVIPDLAFFSIVLDEKSELLSITIIILAISLTVSTIDTLVNAISSLIMVDGKKINKNLKSPNNIVVLLAIISFFVASKGFSVLYLFLLADLFCCAAVFPVFYGFYRRKFNQSKAIYSILAGLFLGLLIFPSTDFSKSILVGTLLPFDLFPQIVSSYLLFWSFLLATLAPVIVIMNYDSFKR